jgi:AmiR/NasT family two-component response regulator
MPTPIILFSCSSDPDTVLRAESHHVLVYLVKPVTKENLAAAIALAQQRHDDFQARQIEPREVFEGLPTQPGPH